MRIRIALFILSLTIIFSSCSKKLLQANKVVIDTENIEVVKIDEDMALLGPCEPSIAINPSDPDKIIAGSILDRIHYSEDGGKTWISEKLTSPYGVYGDPVVGVDRIGNYYYAHLSNPEGKAYASESFLDRIVIQNTKNPLGEWSDGAFPPNDLTKDQDKHWFYIDKDKMLITWTEFDQYGSKADHHQSRILFSQSDDRGNTWSEPQVLSSYEGNCIDDDQTPEGAIPVIDKDGQYHVVWAYDDQLWYTTSTDHGKTWLPKEVSIAKQMGGWVYDIPGLMRCNGMPVLKAHPLKKTLYVNWSDQYKGSEDTDIWFIKSTDGGQSWSERKEVNGDDSGRHQFLTWMDVDPTTGHIYIVYYDRRNTTGDATDVYMSYSLDEGDTFHDVKLTSESFIPIKQVFFGDYNNISAYDGRIRPIWTEFRKGKLSVHTALIDTK